MGKIKDFFHKKSIRTVFAAYMAACILSALILSLIFFEICQFGQSRIVEQYREEYESSVNYIKTERLNSDGSDVILSYYTVDITSLFTPFELAVYDILGISSGAFCPVCFIVCIGITSILFYKRQMQEPLEILDQAADHISENDLNFRIVYHKQNELGKLCASFEKMRLALQDIHMEMWRQIEERKRLNAAFAHDLRTPLTVLKGQNEMLIKYIPKMSEEKITESAKMMQRHILRLEKYVNTMNDLQRLEDVEIQKQRIEFGGVMEQMTLTGKAVCKTKELKLTKEIDGKTKLNLDIMAVMEVYENLLANAVRYAKDTIAVYVSVKGEHFCICVSDDGKGFTEEELSNAAKPFYKAARESNNEHFGMGLNICKILCEKHGGYLKLENEQGACITAAFGQ